MTLVSLPGPQTTLRNIFVEDCCVSTEKGKERNCGINVIPLSQFFEIQICIFFVVTIQRTLQSSLKPCSCQSQHAGRPRNKFSILQLSIYIFNIKYILWAGKKYFRQKSKTCPKGVALELDLRVFTINFLLVRQSS